MRYRTLAILTGLSTIAVGYSTHATDSAPTYPCPNNKPCKVVTLDDDELRILTGPNGILPTASSARSLDLGQFVVYFTDKLQSAPQGQFTPPPEKPAVQGNPALGAGPMNPAAVKPAQK